MIEKRLPFAKRLEEGLREGIQSARGERDDLVETWVDIEATEEAIRNTIAETTAETTRSGGRRKHTAG